MKVYYHVTETKNLPSIQKHGLTPRIGERSQELGEDECVFLFPTQEDMDTALGQWLGEWFEDMEEETDEAVLLSSLEVSLPPDFPVHPSSVEYEVVVKQPIPSRYIQFHKNQ